ncbi:DUF72 domain-containing protein [Rubripirellula sp.]|jgi:uncharacterized protein YecE (DUF72 family)|nr:DUF72 domain-containing protein [Rubripirellula sp.]MDC0287996.1 DUF72 domain-containing protein [Rubripirellula sp.]
MMTTATKNALPIFLGCPVWACGQWAGEVYPARTPRKDWLHWYSRTFNTVEGNSTFYALPAPDAIKRWIEQTSENFRFALKFPRTISHELELEHSHAATREFLQRIEPLREALRLGPTFLQLGPRFGPDRLPVLARFLELLPRDFSWAVELRHHDWFDAGENEKRVNDLLRRLEIDKVLFDSRPLFQTPPDDEIEKVSQERKPRTPVRQTVTGYHPMLRLVGRNRVELTDRFLNQWVPIIAGWIQQGLEPYVFTHAPDDRFAVAFARRLAERLKTEIPETDCSIPWPPAPVRQLSLLHESGDGK